MALAGAIARRLNDERERLRGEWARSTPVHHFFIDDVLPADLVQELFQKMPSTELLSRKHSLRESKWVGVQLERYDSLVGEFLLAFQAPEVLAEIAAITGIRDMHADPSLYASGISLMEKGDFLNPHLDNSHDGDQRDYRVLNLLFYVSPGWSAEDGGNLELWTDALDTPNVVLSKFNRLVVMETSPRSWHSVQPVVAAAKRYCVSNYYFSPHPVTGSEYRNVTSFRGRPEQLVRRALLRLDSALLNVVGRVLPVLLRRNRHRRR